MEDVSKFKYTIGLNIMIQNHKKDTTKANRGVKADDRISANDKLAKMHSSKKMSKYIQMLLQSEDVLDNEIGRQLKLEREYVRKLEKENLYIEIERVTGQVPGGSYNLGEIGEVLGLTRERIRQIEASAVKTMKHPLVLRKLKEMKVD